MVDSPRPNTSVIPADQLSAVTTEADELLKILTYHDAC